MASRYSIERDPPSLSRCDCCGGLTVRLTRFVNRDDAAFAVYYVRYSNNHPENELFMLISVGPWGEGSAPEERSAFFCKVRPTEDAAYTVMLANGNESPWADVELLGKPLSRAEALQHPMKATIFELLDDAFVNDRTLAGWHVRVASKGNRPLERTFGLPDDIFRLSLEERAARAKIGESIARLDGRFFVRSLFPRSVEGHGVWSFGLWIEVAKDDLERISRAWDDPTAYLALRFTGRLANDLTAEHQPGAVLGAPVEVAVKTADVKPYVHASSDPEVAALLARVWPRDEFEMRAVEQGFL